MPGFLDLETMFINFLLAPFTAPALERELKQERSGHIADRAAWNLERDRLSDEIERLKRELEDERTKRAEYRAKAGAEEMRLNSEVARLSQELQLERTETANLREALAKSDKVYTESTAERGRLTGENLRLRSELEERKAEYREELTRLNRDLGNEKALRATEVAQLTKALEDERRAREDDEYLAADDLRVMQSTTEARTVPLDETPITYKELRHLAASLQDDRSRRLEDVLQIQKLLEEERSRFAKEAAQLIANASSDIHDTVSRRNSRLSMTSTVELAESNSSA